MTDNTGAHDLQQLWQQVENTEGMDAGWYNKAVEYWDKQEASYDGVLGGFGHVSEVDVRDSEQFLKKALGPYMNKAAAAQRPLYAVDCGAGVGRVTQELLLRFFNTVDLVEPSEHLLEQARANLTAAAGTAYPRDHSPDDLVAFFKRCHAGLKPGGVLFVKENVCKEGFEVDEDDSSVTRSHEYMLQLFKQADLRLLYSGLQKNFPPQLYKVRMYALQP